MDELALEIFYILTERDIKTLGDQKDFCRHIAKWHLEKLAQLEAENRGLKMGIKLAKLYIINLESGQPFSDKRRKIWRTWLHDAHKAGDGP